MGGKLGVVAGLFCAENGLVYGSGGRLSCRRRSFFTPNTSTGSDRGQRRITG
jgi:hypothetical protein